LFQNPLRIGILSFAHGHAHSYLACLHNRRDVQVVGLYDDDWSRGHRVADQSALPFFPSAAALLAEGLDGVVICAENAKHRPLAEQAAGKVRAILCEKPIATTLTDAQAMIDCCTATQTKLQNRLSCPLCASGTVAQSATG
jgi:predicted dehydrogenase